MFNRLPIYNRPKEPAIGSPTLVGSTNPRYLGGLNVVEQYGPDGQRLPSGPFETGSLNKSLPRLPSPVQDFNDRPEIMSHPALRESTPPANIRYDSRLDPRNHEIPSSRSSTPEQKLHVARKPAPPPRVRSTSPVGESIPRGFEAPGAVPGKSGEKFGISTTIVGGGSPPPEENRKKLHRISSSELLAKASTGFGLSKEAAPAPKSGGFALGNLLGKRKDATGRRKPSASQQVRARTPDPLPVQEENLNGPDEFAREPVLVKPAGLNSIDDWLVDRQGLHQRSNTMSTVSSKAAAAAAYKDPLKLQLRKSAFQPLEPPEEFTASDAPPMPTLPKLPSLSQQPQKQEKPRMAYAERPRTPPEAVSRALRPPSPALKLPELTKGSNTKVMDHISALEEQQEKMEAKKLRYKRQLDEILALLPEYLGQPSSETKKLLNQRKEELEELCADLERDLYDVGMKISRAVRRQRKMEGTGPTHLWVSRVLEE